MYTHLLKEALLDKEISCVWKVYQKQLHEIFGEPSGALFGVYGDVYLMENGGKITMYYHNNSLLKEIVIENDFTGIQKEIKIVIKKD